MLVLSRKVGEVIHIGNGIHLTVVEIRGDKVRLGIEAPKDVSIWRGELVGDIKQRMAKGQPLAKIEEDLDLQDQIKGDEA